MTFRPESGLVGRPASPDLDPVPEKKFMFRPDFLCIPMHSIIDLSTAWEMTRSDESVSRRGSRERNGGIPGTTMSSAAIVSA